MPSPSPTKPAGGKLGTALAQLQTVAEGGGDANSWAQGAQLDVNADEQVAVEVYVNGNLDTAAQKLADAGMAVQATSAKPLAVVAGSVAVSQLQAIAELKFVRSVLPIEAGGVDPVPASGGDGGGSGDAAGQGDAGVVQSAGDAAHRGPAARALGTNGSGVKVGVISDSINQVGTGISASQATGDLPAGAGAVLVVSDQVGGSDEGRAMAEIIYDTAPGVTQFVFGSGTSAGAVGKANAINALTAAGARVIADDIFHLTEPFFQDGQVSLAVDAARAAGVTYFASAGNRARQSWEGTYANSVGNFHNFAAIGTDSIQTIATVPNGGFIQVTLQWDEAWGAAATDIDALLRTTTGATLPGSATTGGLDFNVTTGLPREVVTWNNTSGGAVQVALRINRFSGTASPFMKYIARGNFGSFTVAEYATNSDTINPDAAAASGAIAVAAVNAADAGLNTPETFSSRGPKQRRRTSAGVPLATPETRQRPQIAAADAVNTTVPGFAPFFGTSAATPSAAAIAVLMLSGKPGLTPAQVEAALSDPNRATDCEPIGLRPDIDCGAGFIFADSAVSQALDPTPPVITGDVTGPLGANGWRTGDAAVAWSVLDAGSVITAKTGCVNTLVNTDTTGLDVPCAATSLGGNAAAVVTIKRDTVAPSVPVINGIAAAGYTTATVPPAAAISCSSTDATSGLASCAVSGYNNGPGTHTLTALAIDNAGLASASTLQYSVVQAQTGGPVVIPPAAISSFTGPKRVKPRRAATFGVTISQAATLTMSFAKASKGKSVGGQCVKKTRKNRKARKCTLYTNVGAFQVGVVPGANKVVFSGKLNGRALKRATYRVTATPTSVGGVGLSAVRSLRVR